MKKMKRILARILLLVLFVTCSINTRAACGNFEEVDVYVPEKGDLVQDPVLHWTIRSALNLTTEHDIVLDQSRMAQVTDISFAQGAHPEIFETWTKPWMIESLSGLEYATSATLIEISYVTAKEGNSLQDLSPIENLTKLKSLWLVQDGIKDVAKLNKLVNLQELHLAYNEIQNVEAVNNMKKLNKLDLSYNQISSIEEVKNLKALTYLDVSHNKLESLPDLSNLKNVTTFHAGSNNLQNADLVEIAKMEKLNDLDITSNENLTDLKPLAVLTDLESSKTLLPDQLKEEKQHLFDAIAVNKVLKLFSINHMTMDDIANAEKAVQLYEALEAKDYIDAGRMAAVKSNVAKVKRGEDPDVYEQYADDNKKTPVFDRIVISVVDKYGHPVPNCEFTKQVSWKEYTYDPTTVTTNEKGKLVLIHSSTDTWYDNIVIRPKEGYQSEPEMISYAVDAGKSTIKVNGEEATGLEELQFKIIPVEEYVDCSKLKDTIKLGASVDAEYKYTTESYGKYQKAFEGAKATIENPDATQQQVDECANELEAALKSLKKMDVLTVLKLNVYDKFGNPFTRAFRVQMYDMTAKKHVGNPSKWEEGLIYANGVAGHTYRIWACEYEPYEMQDKEIIVKLGKTADGKVYYSEINGSKVTVDYEKKVVAIPRPNGAPDKLNERKPDPTVMLSWIEEAKVYEKNKYTEKSYQALEDAIENAELISQKENASQEEYNEATAKLREAITGLQKRAKKLALKEAILELEYLSRYYTAESYKDYEKEYGKAKELYEDSNATQEEVDLQILRLKASVRNLINNEDAKKFFYGKVIDQDGNGVSDISFDLVVDGKVKETLVSDILGRIRYQIKGSDQGKTITVQLADSHYKTEDVHTITVDSNGLISNVDGDTFVVSRFFAVSGIQVSGISNKIAAGKKIALNAVVSPTYATDKAVVWSSSNPAYASVDQNGIVTTTKAGAGRSVTITVAAKDGSGAKTNYAIHIMKGAVKKIKITGKKTVKAGKTTKLKAKVSVTKKSANKTLKWVSSNEAYASVMANGKVITKKVGKGKKVKITAFATDGSGKKKTITIKIK